MIKYFTTLQNERGDVLPNYRAQVTDSAGSVVTIYADKGGTRFTDASGNNVNYATADEKGRISFYFTPAVGQTLQTLDVAGNLQDGEADFADSMVLGSLPGSIAQSAVTDLTTDLAAKAATADLASTASGKGAGLVGMLDGGTVQDHFNADGDLLFTFGTIGNPSGSSQNMLFRNASAGATRIHQEPNGYIDSGTVTKYDWMFDPYELDGANYRIFNVTTSVGDVNGTGESGIAYMGAKNAGNHFGLWSSIHFGFSDDNVNGVPLKLHYVDHTQSQHYTPATGAWRSGKSYTTGDYVTTLQGGVGRIYVAATTGTAGATVPSHTSGTVSDGAVNWTFVHAVSSPNVRPLVLIGNRDDMPKLGNSSARLQLAADGIVWNGAYLNFLDGSDAEAWEIGTQAFTDDLYIRSANGGFIRFDNTGKFAQWSGLSDLVVNVTATDGDTTPSIDGTRGILLNNSSATTITQFDDGKGGQVFYVEAANGNTTLQHGTNLRLFGEKNRTLVGGEMLAFRCNSNGQSARQISPMGQAAAVADLSQTISATPTQAEVQAISDKVDALLASLRGNGVLDT